MQSKRQYIFDTLFCKILKTQYLKESQEVPSQGSLSAVGLSPQSTASLSRHSQTAIPVARGLLFQEGTDPSKHGGVHLRRNAARLRILLARMVDAE